jgi:hypothetical protein
LNGVNSDQAPPTIPDRYGAGIADLVILPLVLIALAAKKLLDAVISFLIRLLDWAFPILLQIMRFPLFTLRILGDAGAAFLRGVVGFMPVSGEKRAAWREAVRRGWSWLRQKISYKVFEEAVHHAFEAGMAWVFKRCKSLTPGGALLVLVGAVLWLPISFAVATAMHAVLIAKAASLPAWTQGLHLLATVIAKSKLLVLPVYPASWPQAKQHPAMQAMFRCYRYLASLYLIQKTRYRYRQMDLAATHAVETLRHAAGLAGLGRSSTALLSALNGMAAQVGSASRGALARTGESLSKVPIFGAIVASYAAHYDGVGQQPPEKFSRKVGSFFERWSIKFTAEYYEAKERGEAAKGGASA